MLGILCLVFFAWFFLLELFAFLYSSDLFHDLSRKRRIGFFAKKSQTFANSLFKKDLRSEPEGSLYLENHLSLPAAPNAPRAEAVYLFLNDF